MGIGSFQSGWETESDNNRGSGGGNGGPSEAERLYKFKFFIGRPSDNKIEPGKPITHRLAFITDVPFRAFEHSMWEFKATKDFNAICLKKNNLWKECPACSAAKKIKYPFYNGYFQCIDMGQVEYGEAGKVVNLYHYSKEYKNEKEGTTETRHFRFPKKVIALKIGTPERPGRLDLVHNEISRLGHGMYGTVWDVTRSGEKTDSVGDSWRLVSRVTEEQMITGLRKHGATDDEIDVKPLPWIGTGGIFNVPDPEAYYNKMCEMVGWRTNPDREDSQVSGAGFGSGYESGGTGSVGDDDIPF